MAKGRVYRRIPEKDLSGKLLSCFNQPLTVKQISAKLGIPQDTCRYIISKYHNKGWVKCINPNANACRLYRLTKSGFAEQKKISQAEGISFKEPYLPDIDWAAYGRVCFRHRAAVIKTLTEPMQPAKIKRVLRISSSKIKISANNIRDVLKFLVKEGVVRKVFIKGKSRPEYELTPKGLLFRHLLLNSISIGLRQNS